MRLAIIILAVSFIVGCSALSVNKSNGCDENLTFKKEFFEKIENVEKYVEGTGDGLKFEESIAFLSKYVEVSTGKMLNYTNSYTSKDDFLNDKKSWLEWYEKHKCQNIQLK